MGDHVRYFEIAGITIQVESDLPITDTTFHPKFEKFRVEGPGDDTVVIRHHFGPLNKVPACRNLDEAQEVYHRAPWSIYRTKDSWVYRGVSPAGEYVDRVAVFSSDYCQGDIYNDQELEKPWRVGGIDSLTLFSTDQILVAQLLANRGGCYLHSAALKIDDHGLVFIGHSGAGKSTTARLVTDALDSRAEILCDDRNVIRSWPAGRAGEPAGFYLHGTWSHGDVPEVSSSSVPLRAILFLEQHARNEIVRVKDDAEIVRRVLATLIKPLPTQDWWEKEMGVVESVALDVPCYLMRFDQSGAVVQELEKLLE